MREIFTDTVVIKVAKGEIPEDSPVRQFLPADYSDAFSCEIPGGNNLTPDRLQILFWLYRPTWLIALFKLRAVLVKPFGIHAGNNVSDLVSQALSGGGDGPFRVAAKTETETETVICSDDKHLLFYISVRIDRGINSDRVIVMTIVRHHNLLGRIYFFCIRPFHTLLVPAIVKSVVVNYLKQI